MEPFDELARSLASALETMAGARPTVTWDPLPAAPAAGIRWRSGGVLILAGEEDWSTAGGLVLKAAGIEQAEPEERRATYLEVVKQTLAGGQEVTDVPTDARWAEVHVTVGATSFTLAAGIEGVPSKETSKTFDLLLDVELPVSVSFGRAQIPLKDVLKLSTGSIVELNRSVSEPVEIIVNNCVIARGEVVVVEGNFGVRIQQVVSRQERLRTLQ